MSIASIKAGKAFYEIFAEDKTSKGLSSAEAALMKFGTKIGLVGAGMAAFSATAMTGLTAMIKGFAGAGDEISDAMNVTGLSSDFLQTLKFGAADAGVEFNALVGSISKFNNTLAKAAAKGGTIAGLDAKSLLALSPDQRILAVAEAISKIPDPAMRAKAAMEAFGKSGAKLLPALEGGAGALADQMADLKARGLIMSDEDRQLAVEAEGAFLSLSLALSRVGQVIAAAVTPAFLKVMDAIQTVVEAVVTFIDNNRTLVMVAAGTVVAIGTVGVVLMGLGAVCIGAALATTGLTMAMAGLAAILGFISSPFVVITAAIVACGAAALVSAYYLDQLFNSGRGFNAIADAATNARIAVELLTKAIVAGEWTLLGELIAATIEAAFDGAILSIKQKWSDLLVMLGQDALDLSADVAGTTASALKMASLVAKVAQLGTRPNRPNLGGLPGSGALQAAAVAMTELQTSGAMSSAAVGRINQSAPANQWQDKMLKEAEETNDTLKTIKGHLEDLDNLTVE